MFKFLVILTIFVFCNESRHLYNRRLSGRSLRSRNFKYYYLLREPPRDFNVFLDLLTVSPSGISKRNCVLPKNTCDYDHECPSYQICCEDTFCDFKVCKSVSDKTTKKPEVGNEVLKEQECSSPCVQCVLFDIKCNYDYNCPPCYSCCQEQCKHVNATTTETGIESTTDFFTREIEESKLSSDLSSEESVSESSYYTTEAARTSKISTLPPSVATEIPQSSIEYTTEFFSSLETDESNLHSEFTTTDKVSVSESTHTAQTTTTTIPTTTKKISTLPPSEATKVPQSSKYTTDFVSSLELSSELSTRDEESANETKYTTQTTATATITRPTTTLKPSTISTSTTTTIPTTTKKNSTLPPSEATKVPQSSIKYTTDFVSSLEPSSELTKRDEESANETKYTTQTTATATITRPTTTLKPSTISASVDLTTSFNISSTNRNTVDTDTTVESSGSGSGDDDDDEDSDVHRTTKTTKKQDDVSAELTTGFIISSTNRGTVDTTIEGSGSGNGDDDEDSDVAHITTKITKKEDDDAFFFTKDISEISTDQPHDKKGKRDDDFEFSNSTATDKNKLATSDFVTPTVLKVTEKTTPKDLSYTGTSTITADETTRNVVETTTNIIFSVTTININRDPSTAKPSTTTTTTVVPTATVHTINSQPPSTSTTAAIESNTTAEFNTITNKEVSSQATATASAISDSITTTSTIPFTETTTWLSTLSRTEKEITLSVNGSNLITTTSNVVSTSEYISSTRNPKEDEGSGDRIINTLIDQESSGSGSGDDSDDEDLQKEHTKSDNRKEWENENKSTVKPDLEARKEEEESDYESIDKIIKPKLQSGNLVDNDYYVIIDDFDEPKFNIKRSEKVKAKEKNKREQKI